MSRHADPIVILGESLDLAVETLARVRSELDAERSARRAAEAERDRYLHERDQARATVEYLQGAMPR